MVHRLVALGLAPVAMVGGESWDFAQLSREESNAVVYGKETGERRRICQDEGRALLGEYHAYHLDDEIGWPALLGNGIARCVRDPDPVEPACDVDAMEWVEMNVAIMYSNKAEAALVEIEARRGLERAHLGEAAVGDDDGVLYAEKHEKAEINRHLDDAQQFFRVAVSCRGNNGRLVRKNAEAWGALAKRVRAIRVGSLFGNGGAAVGVEHGRYLVDEGGHADVDGVESCPWSIYEAQEYVETQADVVRTHLATPLSANLNALFPSHHGNAGVAAEPASAYEEGDRIEARYGDGGGWYPGRISAVRPGRADSDSEASYDVEYDDGDAEFRKAPSAVRRAPRYSGAFNSLGR